MFPMSFSSQIFCPCSSVTWKTAQKIMHEGRKYRMWVFDWFIVLIFNSKIMINKWWLRRSNGSSPSINHPPSHVMYAFEIVNSMPVSSCTTSSRVPCLFWLLTWIYKNVCQTQIWQRSSKICTPMHFSSMQSRCFFHSFFDIMMNLPLLISFQLDFAIQILRWWIDRSRKTKEIISDSSQAELCRIGAPLHQQHTGLYV